MTTNQLRKDRHTEMLLSSLPDALRLYSPKQVARILQVDPILVRRMVREGQTDGWRVGCQIRVPQTSLEKFLQESAAKGAS